MELSRSAKCAFGVAAAVGILAGCSGGGSGVGSQLAPANDASSTRSRSISVLRPDVPLLHRVSVGSHPVRPNRCCVQTLFVSDNGTNEVQLYKYPLGSYQGQLPQPTLPAAPFNMPQGECVDSTNPQHVFIANTGASTIDEYTHAGAFVMQLNDPGEYPVSCSYRSTGPNSGMLAVGNMYATSGASGSVSVYTLTNSVWGTPVTYSPPGVTFVFFVSYQNTTLYLDELASGTWFWYGSMSTLGAFTQIALFGSSCPCNARYPGNVQAFGNYIAVGDQMPAAGSPTIYHVQPNGHVVGSTTIPGSGDIIQFFRKGSRIVAPDAINATANIYRYPLGTPLLTPISSPLVQPIGSAVSHQ